MKLFRQIALSALLTVGAFSVITYTSCTKDACKDVTCQNSGTCSNGLCTCPTGVSGVNCETFLRNTYAGTYKGNGTDNAGGTYTSWGLTFAPTSSTTDILIMTVTLSDNNSAPQLNLTCHLSTNTTFTIDAATQNNSSYAGSGTIDGTTATLSLTETPVGGGTPTVYTFTSMIKQ